MNWANKSVLITGAASGIGENLALELESNNADLILLDKDKEGLQKLENSLNGRNGIIQCHVCDVTEENAINRIIQDSWETMNGIDVVIANAGVGYPTPGDKPQLDRIKTIMDINFDGVVNTVVPALKLMLESNGGRLAMISSSAAFTGFKGGAAYCASKAAVLRFSESLRLDLQNHDVSVTSIHPGWVKTPMAEPYDSKVRYFEVTPEDAAKHIRKAIENRKKRYIFPWQFSLLIKSMSLLPQSLVDMGLSLMPSPEKLKIETSSH